MPSDKGSEFCVINKDPYEKAGKAHLADPNTYGRSRITKAATLEKKINDTWRDITANKGIPEYITRSYITHNSDLPKFYHLIKTHKTGPEVKIRPIVSSCGSPTSKLSFLLNKLLTPLLTDVPAHLQSTSNLLQDIRDIPSSTRKDCPFAFSMDVIALYTSIPLQEAISNAVRYIQEHKSGIYPLTPADLGRLLEAILLNSAFTFLGESYSQKQGLPMGNPVSGVLAILFMDRLEKATLVKIQDKVAIYRRYVDDTFILARDKEAAINIFNFFNNAHPNIKFEIEFPDKSGQLKLLDCAIQIGPDGAIHTDFYQKKAKSSLLPHFRSSMTSASRLDIVRNEVKRRRDRCPNRDRVRGHLSKFRGTLSLNGYPEQFIDEAMKPKPQKANVKAAPAGKSKDEFAYLRFPHTTDSMNRKVKKIFKDAGLKVRLYDRPMTLRRMLSQQPPKDACSLKNCTMNNKDCMAKSIVYKLTCEACGSKYIGSTFRTLHQRVKEHLAKVDGSVRSHQQSCGAPFAVKVMARETDRVALRFTEAFIIDEEKATINSRSEREELYNLVY